MSTYDVRLAAIETISVSISPKKANFDGSFFHFDMHAEGKADALKSLLLFKIDIKIRDNNDPEEAAFVSMLYAFELKNFSDIVRLTEEKIYSIPPDLEFQLRNISLSTTRGVLYSLLKGTYLNGATLPIIGTIQILDKLPE